MDRSIAPAALGTLIEQALAQANTAIGKSIDGETLPRFLERVIGEFLLKPIDLNNAAGVTAWLSALLVSFTPEPEIV